MADRTVKYRLLADITGFQAQMAAAGASVRKAGADMTAATKDGDKFRRGLDETGRTAGRVGLIAAAGLGVMILKASNFESAMSNVSAATHETADNLLALRNAAMEAGAATQYSATEAAGAIENLAKAGVSTKDILGGGLQGALDLAAAGQLAVADAAEYTATALTQFQLAGTKATHVADLLAAGAGKAQGEVSDMALALDYAGVPAASLGVSIEETAGTIALFAKNGIVGEKAGTGLRGMLSSLTSPSKIAAKTMGELGIEMFNAKGKFIGLDGVAAQLQERMAGLTDKERSLYLGRIFGNEQLQAANVLYREGARGVKEWTRNVDDSGYAAETARIKTDNLRGDIERLGGALDTLLIKGGEGSQGFLRGLTQGATNAVDAFNKLPPVFSGTLSGMLAITAITGGGLWFGTKVVRGIADTREALSNLGDTGTRVARGMKLVSAAAAGFTVLLVAAEGIKAIQRATDEALPSLDTFTQRLLALRGGQLASLGSEFDSLGDSINRIADSDFKINPLTGAEGNFSDFLQKPFEPLFGEAKGLREARAEVDLLDQSLAGMVSSGHPDAAAESLSAFARANGLSADQMEILRENTPAYDAALAGMSNSATLAADAHEGMGKKVKIAGQEIHFTEEQIKAASDAYADAREDAAGVAAGFFDISKNADKAKVSLGQWIHQMEKQAEALENFTANAKTASKKGLSGGLIDELERMGPVGALRLKQLANASEEIKRANRAYKRGQDAIEAYIDATTVVPDELRTDLVVVDDSAMRAMRHAKQVFAAHPKSLNTQLKVDNDQAMAGIRAVEARLARLTLKRVIRVTLEHQEVKTGGSNYATGGAVFGPGTSTSDSISARLSNGEHVWTAREVANAGGHAAVKMMRSQFSFAGGGPVGRSTSAGLPVGAGIDYERLAAVMANGAPFIGSATFNSQGDYERAKREQRRRAGIGGRGTS